MVEKYTRKPNTNCIVCSKAIYRRPGVIEKSQGKVFCSMVCNGIYTRIEIPCVVCGKKILSGQNKKSCSRSCANVYRSGIKYKIGRPKDKAKTAQYIKLELIRKRGALCEKCGYSNRKILQVHHKNRNHGDNRRENLEIICPNCHCEEHYGEKL